MNIESIALRKLLAEPDLEIYSQMHTAYFTGAFKSVFKNISEYYAKYGKIPTLEGLKLTTRHANSIITLSSLELIEPPQEEWEVVLDALVDNYAQTEVLERLSVFVDGVSLLSAEDIKENLAKITLDLDSEIDKGSKTFDSSELTLFKPREERAQRTPLGFNEFDAKVGGAFAQKLYIPGGRRGSGKSWFCTNVSTNQYKLGNVAPYFTIEMTKDEVFERMIGILSGVSSANIEKDNLTDSEINKLVQTRCDFYINGEEVYQKFLNKEFGIYELEHVLSKTCKRKEEQLVIVDDRSLSITTIDLELQKLKAKYGDKLQVAVIDYLNQITMDGKSSRDMYDWTYQIQIAKTLKNLARKYEICIICPIQLDDANQVRYAKGILDAPDLVWSCDWDKGASQLELNFLKDRFAGIEEGSRMMFNVDPVSMHIKPEEVVVSSEPEGESKDDVAPW